ncbi:MAG TPA: hypothetical protein VGL58_05760 [Caulobacteraceae bacterium]
MKKLLIAAALTLAPAVAFADTWTVNGAFGDAIKYTVTCDLTNTAGALAGTCTDPQGGANVNAKGTVSASAFELAYDTTYQGAPLHLDYKGAVAADGSVSGAIDAGGPQGTFTATKK